MKLEDIKVLVACEESQAVCIAFRKLGVEAYSCDLQECSGGHQEWHIQGDAIKALYYREWNLVIAHPPCTRLANSGVRWLHEMDLTQELNQAIDFFNKFIHYGKSGGLICIENPIPHKYACLPKYTQLIQPYQFGHAESKATCLWLYGLPQLTPTNDVKDEWKRLPKKHAQKVHYASPGKDRAKIRSKTFSGIAQAMAEQWTKYLLEL